MQFTQAQLEDFREAFDLGFRMQSGSNPTAWERQAVMAQAWLETSFGLGWKGVCADSNNWGAVQSRTPTCCRTTDSYQDGRKYQVHFVCYETEVDGAAGLVYEAVVKRKGTLAAAAGGDLGEYARLLYEQTYYGGLCGPWPVGSASCKSKVILDYALGLQRYSAALAKAFGETPIPIGTLPASPASLAGGGSSSGGIAAFGLLGIGAVGLLALTLATRRSQG